MKQLKAFFAVIFCMAIFFQVQAFAQEMKLLEPIANSGSHSITLDVDSSVDSVVVGIFTQGEIDIDTIDVKLGVQLQRGRTITYYAASDTNYSKTLTVNLDSAGTAYTGQVTTIPKSALRGYNKVMITVTAASSGNTATDYGQALGIVVTVYKP